MRIPVTPELAALICFLILMGLSWFCLLMVVRSRDSTALGMRPADWGMHEKALRAAHVLSEFQQEGKSLQRSLELAVERLGTHYDRLRSAAESLDLISPNPAGVT